MLILTLFMFDFYPVIAYTYQGYFTRIGQASTATAIYRARLPVFCFYIHTKDWGFTMPVYTTTDLFDLTKTIAQPLLSATQYPWEALADIGGFILRTGPQLPAENFDHPAEDIWIAKSAVVAPSASITGPCIIDENAEIRHCAFIRGNAVVGKGAVVGNSCELKNSILFDCVQVPHFNYVGDSVLGYKAHFGAGCITSNVKSDKSLVVVKNGEDSVKTERKKVGALVGDWVEVGCNSVLNPGCVLGRESQIYPVSCVRGTVPANCIYKSSGQICPKV